MLCRDLETRMGTTPPPSPSDKMDHVALNARVVQLSNEVDRLKKLLSRSESKRENWQATCVLGLEQRLKFNLQTFINKMLQRFSVA